MGLLHDIGKIAVDEALLNKNGTFTNEERKNIEQHPAVGYRILNLFDDTIDLAEGVLYHHENWDGSGYPIGARGEEIPRQARILRVAETYDALRGAFHSSAMSPEEALAEIERHSGGMFDPEIVRIFVGMMSGAK
jgi:HD-GYP domain-containing protein (c-di-GMP phosphodiesterase class II)